LTEGGGPLGGLRVVEVSEGIAGPYAGKLLADYGADVVKVEPADGDRSRHVGPFPDGLVGPEQSALFLHLNTNKRSIVADAADQVVTDLIARADLVIQSSPIPDPAELRANHPALVVLSVTSFGLTGPHAGLAGEEIVHYAYGGPMSATGSPDREPLKMGGALGQYQAGSVAAVAALAALAVAERRKDGVHIDLSNIDTQIGSIDRRMTYLLYAAYRNANVDRSGGYQLSPFPSGARPTLDGHIQISTLMNWIPRMLAVVDNPELSALFDDPGFIFDEAVPELADAHILGWSLTATRQEAMMQAQEGNWPVTAINRPIDLLSDPHFEDRGFFTPVDHPVVGSVRQPGAPIRMGDGWQLRRPAPTLGQHTEEVTAELAATPSGEVSEPATTADDGAATELPLHGVRVLDMTVVWAGPYATCMLGDLGAEIIRVDNPAVFPSATRGVLPRPTKEMVEEMGGIFGGYPDADPGDRPWNRVALFNAHARNKKSVTLDLRHDSGREAFLRLAEQCDVMIENNSVDLLDKLGIGWETLRERNPSLILVRMPSVGLDGPYRNYLGFGVNFEGLCGLTAVRGYEDVDTSESETVFHMDAASGSAGAFAALMALRRRERTGVGELIELSQSENMLNHIGELLVDAGRTGREHRPLGNRHHHNAPQGCYRCVGDDAWAVISVADDAQWQALAAATGNDDWATDPRFSSAADRHANHDELDVLLSAWTEQRTPAEVFSTCQQAGIAAAPVLHELEALADEHLQARGLFMENGNDSLGTHLYPGHLWRWDGPDLAWGPIPVLGGDNEHVFKDIVGLSDDDYADLDAGGHLRLDYVDPEGNPL
jgi:crotonobetainyl-CoA:carnitine CoA-transferase CaiB-like acyl-CoA transferase